MSDPSLIVELVLTPIRPCGVHRLWISTRLARWVHHRIGTSVAVRRDGEACGTLWRPRVADVLA